MSKIQERLSFKDLANHQTSGELVDIVIKTGQVFRVIILQIIGDEVSTRNALGHKNSFKKSEIVEMWSDKKQQLAK